MVVEVADVCAAARKTGKQEISRLGGLVGTRGLLMGWDGGTERTHEHLLEGPPVP